MIVGSILEHLVAEWKGQPIGGGFATKFSLNFVAFYEKHALSARDLLEVLRARAMKMARFSFFEPYKCVLKVCLLKSPQSVADSKYFAFVFFIGRTKDIAIGQYKFNCIEIARYCHKCILKLPKI